MATRAATLKMTTPAKTTTPAKKVVRVRKPAAAPVVLTAEAQTLHAYIPDPSVATGYIGRKVMGGVWDATVADNARRDGDNMLLIGDTGSGKTLFGEAYASKNRLMYYSVPCDVSIDPSSLFGKMVVTDVPGKYEWQDGPVTAVVRHGGVLNISEVNMMPPRIAASMYSLLDHRRYIALLAHKGEIVRAAPNTLLIGDMNDKYRGTMELNAAFKNRWAFKIPWGYSDEVEAQLLKFPTLRTIAKKMRELSGVEIMTPVSTNLLMEFERFALNDSLGLDFAIGNFVNAFASEEQSPVEKVVELHRSKLDADIAFLTGKQTNATDDELEEIDFDFVLEGE